MVDNGSTKTLMDIIKSIDSTTTVHEDRMRDMEGRISNLESRISAMREDAGALESQVKGILDLLARVVRAINLPEE